MNKLNLSVIAATMAVASVMMVAPVAVKAAVEVNITQTEEHNKNVINIPVSTVVFAKAGEKKILISKNVPNGEYNVKVVAVNQSSVHPNNDIIVRSNGVEVTVFDVESEAFGEAEADGTLTVTDGKVAVYIKMGKDKVFSGGVDVVLTEVVPEPEQEPKPEPEPEAKGETVEKPEILPATGAGSILGAFTGASGISYAAHRLINRKRQ